MAQERNDKQLTRWLNGEVSEEELQKDLPQEDVNAYKQILQEIDGWVPDNDRHIFDVNQVFNENKASLLGWKPLSIAASILLIASIGIWSWYVNSSNLIYEAAVGEMRELVLPDGKSKVIIFSGSRVSWNEDDPRSVTLDGKAYFDIEPGNPFEVGHGLGTVQVLGTQFEVDQFDQSVYVACYEGKVRVTAEKEIIELTQGEGQLYDNNKWESKIDLQNTSPSWISTNESQFSDAPLMQVLLALAKVYGLELDTGTVDLRKRFTGVFPHNDLETAVTLVLQPFGISYTIRNKTLILTE